MSDEDKKKEEEKKSDAKGILYLGEDEGYWQDLKESFKAFKQINFEFNLLYETDPKKIQNFLSVIAAEKPKVVFIDLAKNTEEMLHLLRAQNRMNAIAKPFVIALTSYKQGEAVVRQAVMAGAKIVHIKSGEMDAVIYDAVAFAFFNALEDHGFATAKLDDMVGAFIPAKASVVSPKGLRVESNYKVKEGDDTKLNTYWKEKGIIKSSHMKVGSQESKDLFYNFRYAQELAIGFVDPLELPEGSEHEEERVQELKEQQMADLAKSQARMLEWVKDAKPRSRPKVLKTLVIDKDLTVYKDQPLTDSYPFVLRAQPFLIKFKAELMRFMPQMICYNMEEVDPDELEANQDLAHTYNESRNLQYLIKTVKSIGDFEPFIVVFNTPHDTAKLQKVLNYKQIVGYKQALSTDLIVKMGDILYKRYFGEGDPFGETVVVLDKKLEATYAEFETGISLTAVSENDIYFDSDEEFGIGTVLRIKSPVNMYLTIAEAPKHAKSGAKYYALINGIGEEERKDLRKYINSVFFREKEAAKIAEMEEVEKTKQKYIEEQKKKEEEEKKKAEEEEKKKAQEEERIKAEREAQKKAQQEGEKEPETDDEAV